MKRLIAPIALALCTTMLGGCLAFSLGGGTKTETTNATVGKQLSDLKSAKDAGALTDAEYEVQKAKILSK